MARFVPRQRKHKVRQREQAQNERGDTNASQLLPQSKSEKEEKRRKLKDEISAGQSKISSKKQKRLDKYVETKLKKDENLQLLKNLSQGQASFDTSRLQSSKHLGKRKHAEFVAGASLKGAGRRRSVELSDSDTDSDDSFEQDHANALLDRAATFKLASDGPKVGPPQGSGLKHPVELGKDGLPIITQRRKQREIRTKPPDELPWEGFDTESEGSEVDTTGEPSSSDNSTSMSDLDGSDESDSDTQPFSDQDNVSRSKARPRSSAFKAWATQQINVSLGYTPSHTTAGEDRGEPTGLIEKGTEKTTGDKEPLPPELQYNAGPGNERKAHIVHVSRSEAIQQTRLKLPVVAEEQKIMEAIHNNPVVIIWGATGSGKTTQLPQFLFEAGYGSAGSPTPGKIGVTQPRRVAAVSMAKRVSDELGQHGNKVSYQIRFESTTSQQTAIKFMTDGILLREVAEDFSLSKYSVVIIDEAHERTVNTDILIGMLSRIVDLRAKMSEDPSIKPLKLVIMSATLRMSDFLQNANLFRSGPPPLVEAEGRQYPVTNHFARQTKRDYLDETFRKVSKGHGKLPPGGFLVFLTGQNEIKALLNRLGKAFPSGPRTAGGSTKDRIAASEAPLEAEDLEMGGLVDIAGGEDISDVDIFTGDGHEDEEDDKDFDIGEESSHHSSIHLLPLYSQLPTKDQLRVFEAPPIDSRMIVLSTNVAETSLTIPGIRYVFDCGRSKERQYNQSTGVQSFEIGWISKASAEQRAGRAGRTGPGHCYRLYSSAVYERDFVQHTDPEILRTPIESVVLQMKTMGLDNIVNFPYPTPPARPNLIKAEKLLKYLGALDADAHTSQLGRKLSIYPLSPRFGKMLAIGSQHGCLPYVIALVAGLTVAEIFIPENRIDMSPIGRQEDQTYTHADQEQDSIRENRRKSFNKAQALFSRYDQCSDALKVLTAVCAFAYAKVGEVFCEEMFLRAKALQEVAQLRRQLTDVVLANEPGVIDVFAERLPEASSKQLKALNQIVIAGFVDQVVIRADLAPVAPEIPRKPQRAIDVPYLALFPPNSKGTTLEETGVYLHPSSVLARLSPKEMPQYLVYSHLQQSASSHVATEQVSKIRFFPLTAASGAQLSALAHGTPLISYGKPIGQILSLGGIPEKRECWVVPSLTGEAGAVGWPLPAKKVLQRKDARTGWIIEKFLS